MGHPLFRCWKRPYAKCSKCNQICHEVEEDQLFVATCFSNNNTCESWLIDSHCTNHMTYDKELFKQLESIKVKWVKIGNLLEKGFNVVFEDNICILKDLPSQEMFKVKIKKKGFSPDPMKEEQTAFPVTTNSIDLRHKRLGHFQHSRISYMLKNQLVRGAPSLSEKLVECEACQFGKQTRKSFPESSWRSSQKLQLIHTNLARPQRTSSLNEKVAVMFWKFKANVENQNNS
ncbi:hypothetical protein CR513_24577, partial [Mucuna pruriens]